MPTLSAHTRLGIRWVHVESPLHETPPVSPEAPGIDGRVAGAESRLRALATRLDALFGALNEPPPTPPWRLTTTDAVPADSAALSQTQGELSSARSELEHASAEIRVLRGQLQIATTRADGAETVNAELGVRLEETRDHAEQALAELASVRSALNRVRASHETTLSDLVVVRAELERARSESGPIDIGGVDPAVFQQLEDELALLKRELDETRRAHAQALEQIAAGLPEPSVEENSVVRALRAEDGMKQMQEHMQRQLLEHEETRRQRDALRRGQEQMRSELRLAQQKRDHYRSQVKAGGDVSELVAKLRKTVAARDKTIEELQAEVRTKERELDTHSKREAHLRQALNRRKTR